MRDVTGTVPSIPLISSSIVSKKIASGADTFVFDVKHGSGALMVSLADAMKLADALEGLSGALGRKSACLVTDMEQPLGEWVGNAVEVRESVDVLSGRGPSDTRALCLALVSAMLAISGAEDSPASARRASEEALDSGAGLRKFAEMIAAQGGDASVASDPSVLPAAAKKKTVESPGSGIVSKMDARSAGMAIRALGGGRLRKEDAIDPSAGLRIMKKIGDRVQKGEPVIEILYNDDNRLNAAEEHVGHMFAVGDSPVPRRELILRKR
jgi:pyrimidine-nucleoside phosphorylase